MEEVALDFRLVSVLSQDPIVQIHYSFDQFARLSAAFVDWSLILRKTGDDIIDDSFWEEGVGGTTQVGSPESGWIYLLIRI